MAARHDPPSRSPSPRSLEPADETGRRFSDTDQATISGGTAAASAPPHKRVRSAVAAAAVDKDQPQVADASRGPSRPRPVDDTGPTSLPPILTKEERDSQESHRASHSWRQAGATTARLESADSQAVNPPPSASSVTFDGASPNAPPSSGGLPGHMSNSSFSLSLNDQANFSRLPYPHPEAVDQASPTYCLPADPSQLLSAQASRSASGYHRHHSNALAHPASAPPTSANFGHRVAGLPDQAVADPRAPAPSSTNWTPQPETSQNRRRGKLPQAVTNILKTWLMAHTGHPYPTEEEKKMLCEQTMLTMNQVSNWFINARRRILVPPSGGSSVHEVRQPARRQAQSQLARAAAQAGVNPPGLNLPPQHSPASVGFPPSSPSFGGGQGTFDFRFGPQSAEAGEMSRPAPSPAGTQGWSVSSRPAQPSPTFQSVPASGSHYPPSPQYPPTGYQNQGFYPGPNATSSGPTSFPAYPSAGGGYPGQQSAYSSDQSGR